jgi:predicted unusual protein kinase regulating ubiquinone biosynthesis (AarF/ABC1/UbiB family)
MHRGGIVHVAELHGEKLAVKVQFPGLRETCQGDTWTIGVLVKAVGWVWDTHSLSLSLSTACTAAIVLTCTAALSRVPVYMVG